MQPEKSVPAYIQERKQALERKLIETGEMQKYGDSQTQTGRVS
jgi:hypothetical protein